MKKEMGIVFTTDAKIGDSSESQPKAKSSQHEFQREEIVFIRGEIMTLR